MAIERPTFHDIYDPEAKPDLTRQRALLFPGVLRGKMPTEGGILDLDNRLPDGSPTFTKIQNTPSESEPPHAT